MLTSTDNKIPKLMKSNDPILYSPQPEFDFDNPLMNPVELYNTLSNALLAYGGVGLSANQIGIPTRAFVLRSDPVVCLINPKIVFLGEQKGMFREGCLSFPFLELNVSRSKVVRVRFQTPDRQVKTEKFIGLTAAVCQHELDHLNGITFKDHVQAFALALANKRAFNKKKRAQRPNR